MQKAYCFAWNTTSPHANKYNVQDKRLTKSGRGTCQITSLHPLPQRSTTTFRFIKYNWGVITLGIVTANRLQSEYSGSEGADQKQSVGYKTWPQGVGAVFIDGQKKVQWNDSLFVEKGGLLAMQVDLSVPKITFVNKRNNNKQSFKLPKHYQQQPVYVFVSTKNKDGALEVVK